MDSEGGLGTNNNRSSPSIPALVRLEESIVLQQLAGPTEDRHGRRKSWHIKVERKRRKGVIATTGSSPPGALGERQKRPSWWNIFVPDHWPSRSRRASQDISRSTDNIVPWPRSKSRSVDHGFSPPFDLDSLRSKVEGRFESVDRLTRGDSDGGGKEGAALTEKKMGKNIPPQNTTTYTVEPSDTLTSVAARFDTTPSELTKLNRLTARLIFPGQLLHVPDKGRTHSKDGEGSLEEEEGRSTTPTESEPEEKDILDNLRPVSPKPLPGHIERVKTPSSPQALSSSSASTTEKEDQSLVERKTYERFLKINVRHITDGQGVVGGVLLVTPNAVMFDPNVSDPLVIEHGPESYGVIAPMEFVVNAAIYYDIAHMRVGHSEAPKSDAPKPEIYHAQGYSMTDSVSTMCAAQSSPGKDSLLVKDETFPELAPARSSPEEDNESVCSCAGREGDAFPKAFERDLVTPTNLQAEVEATAHDQKDGEGRRRSCLDHHWAIPSLDRSLDRESEDSDRQSMLIKQSCHDSGIDIRDPVGAQPGPSDPPINVAPSTKKVFSDADIILAPKSEFVPPLTTATITSVISSMTDTTSSTVLTSDGYRKKTSSVSFSLDSTQEGESKEAAEDGGPKGDDGGAKLEDGDKQETRKNKMLKRLSYPLAWMEGFTGDKDEKDGGTGSCPTSADGPQHSSVFSKVFSRRSSVGTFIRPQPSEPRATPKAPPRLDYRSMVSVDDMPELFVSFDKLIPRPARSCEDPPLYLRLRMGKPMDKKIPKSTPIMSYGKKKMRPEYWFSVPRNRADDLYHFLRVWVPHLYGELVECDVAARGFELVESDTELWEDEGEVPRERDEEDGLGDLTRESWEVLSMSEELRRALYATGAPSLDLDLLVPDLVGTTEVLSEEHRRKLCRHLPARAEGYLWTLVFSTSQHGFSLNSMYRKMNRVESPILMVIEDTDHNVFGALTSCALKVSDHFYGTGESMLFRFNPEFQVFNWTGDNMYFIKGNNESLAIGAGDGKFGLWLDGDLYQGRSEPCDTYGNEALSSQEDFVVKTLECWAFI